MFSINTLYIIIGVCAAAVAAITISIDRYFKQKNELYKYNINMNYRKSYSYIKSELDSFIGDCFSEYLIFNGGNAEFITSEMEEKIHIDVATMVIERLSPAFLDKLILYYSKDKITEVITAQVYLLCTNFVIENNQIRE